MPVLTPVLRLTLGLILLTVSLLFIGELLGFAPNHARSELTARKSIAEALAVQMSTDVADNRVESLKDTLSALVARNDQVLSAGLRRNDGRLLTVAGDHAVHWVMPEDGKSTASHIQVPIHAEDGRWGTVEVSFEPIESLFSGLRGDGTFGSLVVFVAAVGFVTFLLFLKRALNELDPSSVVPDRVKNALDVLVEGLVIVDKRERIVLTNAAFARKLGLPADTLVGRKLSSMAWMLPATDRPVAAETMPWNFLLAGHDSPPVVQMQLTTTQRQTFTFKVTAAPITGPDGQARGAMATFDDVTELERKHADLQQTLEQLRKKEREIRRQNGELHVLATRDPLTGVLNRRSFFEGLTTLVNEAREEGEPLSCIMADIDHFKTVNDRYGHAMGDRVIRAVAKVLTSSVRPTDLVGRYGGEEFCVILPGLEEADAADIAERIRLRIQSGPDEEIAAALRFTSSFGVASLSSGASSPGDLVDYADKALYMAKEAGRNRVMRWQFDGVDLTQSNAAAEKADRPGQRAVVTDSSTGHTAQAPSGPQPKAQVGNPGDYLPLATVPKQVPDEHKAAKGLQLDPAPEVERLRRQVAELETLLTCQRRTAATALDEEAGMASRIVLLDRIRQAIERCRRRDSKLAVLRVDVLTAERISEALGDEASHQIMREVGQRLKQALRATDTIAMIDDAGIGVSVSRSDRGEFVVVLSDMDALNDATWVIQRILKVLAKPFSNNSHEIYLRATIGASQFPADGDDSERLLARSGIALNEAKSAAGGDGFAFYSEELDRESKEQILIESQLHRAVGRGELFLEYQPVVDLRSGRIAAMEALLRWHHPDRGIVPPGAFIPIAEHTGVIESIGEWVIETACRQLRLWRNTGHEQVKMAINLSPVQFRRCDLAERILATVDAERLPREALNFEITESVLMQNLNSAATVVAELRDAGVGVSLDDFGTGYSSLGYLKRFPVDTVKIDRSFLREFPSESNDAAIVHAIISMAHSLGLRVIAEGVETDEQLKSLQVLQCDEVQGFLLSRPVRQDAATAILEQFPAIRQKIRSAGQASSDNGVPGAQNAAVGGLLNELPSRRAAES